MDDVLPRTYVVLDRLDDLDRFIILIIRLHIPDVGVRTDILPALGDHGDVFHLYGLILGRLEVEAVESGPDDLLGGPVVRVQRQLLYLRDRERHTGVIIVEVPPQLDDPLLEPCDVLYGNIPETVDSLLPISDHTEVWFLEDHQRYHKLVGIGVLELIYHDVGELVPLTHGVVVEEDHESERGHESEGQTVVLDATTYVPVEHIMDELLQTGPVLPCYLFNHLIIEGELDLTVQSEVIVQCLLPDHSLVG